MSQTQSTITSQPKTVLAVGAHPDDICVPGGGTIAKWAAQGTEVYFLILTNGDRGSNNPQLNPGQLAAEREDEQLTAAKILGVKEVLFGNFNDCELEHHVPEVRKLIVKLIRQLKPDTMVFWDPALVRSLKGQFANHPDHRVAGQAALDAAALFARNRPSYPEFPGVHEVGNILMVNPDDANLAVDISGYTEAKSQALAAHRGQAGLIAEAAKFSPGNVALENGLPVVEAFVRLDLRG